MSTTTTTTTALASTTLVGMLPSITNTTAMVSGKNCPTCGEDGLLAQDHSDARKRVNELESQVEFLNDQATQMAEKLADYEAQVHRLRGKATTTRNASSVSSTSSQDIQGSLSPPLPSQSQPQGRLSTLASFLPYRRPSAPSSPPPPPHSAPAQPVPLAPPQSRPDETLELQNALTREKYLRREAETQLSQASTELEDLTAQLFSQANEMVAQERRARARLEERVAVLERRDVEKRTRLERLEKAMERVERIRTLVG